MLCVPARVGRAAFLRHVSIFAVTPLHIRAGATSTRESFGFLRDAAAASASQLASVLNPPAAPYRRRAQT